MELDAQRAHIARFAKLYLDAGAVSGDQDTVEAFIGATLNQYSGRCGAQPDTKYADEAPDIEGGPLLTGVLLLDFEATDSGHGDVAAQWWAEVAATKADREAQGS